MSAEAPASAQTRRRLIGTVFAGVGAETTAFFASFTVAPLVARNLTDSTTWTGIPGGVATIGMAVGAASLTAVMSRRGRRTGLALGYACALLGTALSVVALEAESFAVLLVGMLLLGVGHGAAQLARFAAADLAPAARRASVLSWVVWAGTIGALIGPSLLEPARTVAESLGLASRAGGFLIGTLAVGVALVLALALRPEPRDVSAEKPAEITCSPTQMRDRWHLPHVRLALLVMVSVQVAMVLVMTITPVHMREHEHDLAVIGLVMSSHFVGMFAFAPVAGRFTDRFGSPAVMLAGLGVSAAASVVAAASDGQGALLGVGLFALGLGWSFGFVAGSALLTRDLTYQERVQLQGGVDTVIWSWSAAASLVSGILITEVGFAWLCSMGLAIALGALALVARRGVALATAT